MVGSRPSFVGDRLQEYPARFVPQSPSDLRWKFLAMFHTKRDELANSQQKIADLQPESPTRHIKDDDLGPYAVSVDENCRLMNIDAWRSFVDAAGSSHWMLLRDNNSNKKRPCTQPERLNPASGAFA
jgi:hypothetical protein